MSSQEAEEIIRAQAEVFEDLKLYLVKRWNTAQEMGGSLDGRLTSDARNLR